MKKMILSVMADPESGIYTVRIITGSSTEIKKMVKK